MLFVLDVGNTNTVVGLFRGDELVHRWRLSTRREQTKDEFRLTILSLLSDTGVNADQVSDVAIASVVPSLNTPLKSALTSITSASIHFLTPETSPILLDVKAPATVGADRIANCLAAHTLHGGPTLVIDFGTATTFDLVGTDGRFLGGAIAPEMTLAGKALTDRAAQLASVALTVPNSVIGKTTAANIQAGVVLGFLELVDGLIRRFTDEVSAELRVIATGGKGELFYRSIDAIGRYDPALTLKGLRIWRSRTNAR